MALDVSKINAVDKNISFKAEVKESTEEASPVQEEEETSFYQRNKKILLAAGALAAVGIAIGTHHYIKNKNVKDVPVGRSEKLKRFEDNLKRTRNEEDANKLIKSILGEENSRLKMDAIRHILSAENKGKYINANNWEDIMNATLTAKPIGKEQTSIVITNANELYKEMAVKNLLNTDAVDKIITKMADCSDDVKLNLSQRMIEAVFANGESIPSTLSVSQAKKVLGILDGVKTETFNYRQARGFCDKNYTKDGVKYYYFQRYLSEQKPEDYLTELRTVLKNGGLGDNAKLYLINGVYYQKFISENLSDPKESAELAKELLDGIFTTKIDKFTRPNDFATITYDKFDLAYSIFDRQVDDVTGVFTATEQLNIARNIKEMAKNIEINKELFGTGYKLNRLNIKELDLRSKAFVETFTPETTVADVERFTDEMFEAYQEVIANYIKTDDYYDSLRMKELKCNIGSFHVDMLNNIERCADFATNRESLDQLNLKIANFRVKLFGIDY